MATLVAFQVNRAVNMIFSIRAARFPLISTLKKTLLHASFVLLGTLAIQQSAHADGMPDITPSLKKMLGALPLDDGKEELQKMVGALKKTTCGGGLTGCYSTKSGPIQLYFFTSGQAQQTFIVVVDKKVAMPQLLGPKVQKVMGETSLTSPIISISTTDFDLTTVKMPPDLQKVVRDSYFNVSSLSFSSGVQIAARANLGGAIKLTMEAFGVRGDQLTMRAAVVMPIPTDLAGGAGAGAGAASAVQHGDTMKKAGADALKPEAFVEFQFAPNAKLPLLMPPMNLSDATFFINNSLTIGYKGNAAFKGLGDKKILIQFQTPLDPAGAMDLLDFQFRMATPASFTLEDMANVIVAMATPDPRLAKYGGGFVRNINAFKKPLLDAAKLLSVFQSRNPNPPPEYRFGDATKPWPDDKKYFNVVLLGPTAQDGPYIASASDSIILGQKMGWMDASAGRSGLHGVAGEMISIKLGPLGRLKVKMAALADIDKDRQDISLRGNVAGQAVNVIMSGNSLTIDVPPSCVNPFKINTTVAIQASTNIADIFEGQGGVNVDPSKISGCIGKELEAAYKKIAGEYKNLSGYSADLANAELKKISDAANLAAKQAEEAAKKAADDAQKAAKKAADDAKKAAEDARREYEKTKDAARDVANKAGNAANQAFNDAGNAFKKIGKKKKHKKGPDPKFAASVFDWDYYYDNAPDVVKAGVDLATHWRDGGFNEGRQGSPEFQATYYRKRYLDVQALCGKNDLQCVLQHWLDYGYDQGRQGSANFSIASYLNRYPDLQRAFGADNYSDAFEHWFNSGENEGRNSHPDSASDGPVSGPTRAGGDGGGAWSDYQSCAGQYVNGFRIRAGGSVDTVQFRYANQGWAPAQGYQGKDAFTADVTLASGEYIVRVDYRNGSRIDNIRFTTNNGKTYGPYGGGGGSSATYTVTPGEKLGCMAGRAGSSIDQLTFSSTGPR